ncbi:hypothetical protein T440DRAFT_391758 [Plenodomus tracheiphilus IPT5]|uniref:Uncharacterized protein n=1 Tax=Plenodomus tracheiphilus IPT5 TaxID=1408161 RepID=A0A6A7BDZ3_9PLEO|nr:hypothetical protein T440DRAFT_391758 [Plenodomus tracheiphilus IPT5]
MAPKSLLRHIFRDIQPKIDQMRSPHKRDASPARRATASSEAHTNLSTPDRLPPVHPAFHVPGPAIPDAIAEEASAETVTQDSDANNNNKGSASPGLAALTTRELLDITIVEGKLALQSHLESLATALALLVALDGFSQTITVLKSEMLRAQMECKEKLRIMEDIEAVVTARDYDADTETMAGGGEGN